MSGPDRIFAWWEYDSDHRAVNEWGEEPVSAQYHVYDHQEYVRRDPAILAALPEVQAMIAEAVAKEREACAQAAHDAVTHPSAYACREAIRKRGEGKG